MASLSHYVVAVHGGAGFHDPKHDKVIKENMKAACSRGIDLLSNGSQVIDAVEGSISMLEDTECFNAGYGSNLTWDGGVECDASLMEGTTCAFGAVGAVSGIKNPITAARRVLEHSGVQDRLGRIPPLLLVSAGAHNYAASRGCLVIPPNELVSTRAQEEWKYWKILAQSNDTGDPIHGGAGPSRPSGLDLRQDTVGAVALSEKGVAAGVSSGGLLLKMPGRIGEAAVFGAGCWASQSDDGDVVVASSVSGMRRGANHTGICCSNHMREISVGE
ncbi:N-terminal nucleophile aminohydrolase [Punctularia strigosozonata HHB-11173 SS5]|uniref:N-terminal nucleophile aminohydrolase n=1 Tax=Punctularia strigosozonata (strain HHB-11173) TaxID=741275 RepID=UPI000441670F|nr:N-terminal nucleophile aminohydrolase [Punctularia strigosozonata HHB-11173 SS5]EIN11582.1 N-terminal nucleophile aminohydrolase [Punctularia strigosozonata HHB-11173 SS5]